jgi:hypothetical protein
MMLARLQPTTDEGDLARPSPGMGKGFSTPAHPGGEAHSMGEDVLVRWWCGPLCVREGSPDRLGTRRSSRPGSVTGCTPDCRLLQENSKSRLNLIWQILISQIQTDGSAARRHTPDEYHQRSRDRTRK